MSSGQSLYVIVYKKIVAKIIAVRIKKILSEVDSWARFGFLKGGQIHDAIEAT